MKRKVGAKLEKAGNRVRTWFLALVRRILSVDCL